MMMMMSSNPHAIACPSWHADLNLGPKWSRVKPLTLDSTAAWNPDQETGGKHVTHQSACTSKLDAHTHCSLSTIIIEDINVDSFNAHYFSDVLIRTTTHVNTDHELPFFLAQHGTMDLQS